MRLRSSVWIIGLLILASALRPSSMRAAVLYSEDFESGSLASWSVGDSDTGGTPTFWGVVTNGFGGEPTHGGNRMAYCAATGYGGTAANPTYQPQQKSFLTRKLAITNVEAATLRFWYRIPSIEAGVERADVYWGSDLLWTSRAATNTWTEVKLSLVNYLESTNDLKFEFVSDSSVVAEGWYLDDIRITDEYTPAGAPPNNDWANAKRLLLARGSAIGQNFAATSESGEPGALTSSNSIWFRWRALTNGFVSFNTLGSTFDTRLCVYTGTNLNQLTEIACNDNDGDNVTSAVGFQANSLTEYRIRVSGTSGAQGKVRINWDQTNGYRVLLLPDISVLADSTKDFMYGWYLDTNTQPGRVLMRLSSATPNTGLGTLQLIGTNNAPEVYQRIYRGDGSYEDRLAGTFTFHPTHNHLHFNDWLTFRLREVLTDDAVGPIAAYGTKLSFAVIDLDPYNLTLPEAALTPTYKAGFNQGISVGWMDVYHAELPDQWIDVTGIQAGRYWLESMVDPENRVVEINENNNIARILIDLTFDNHPANDDFTNAIPVTTPIYSHVILDNRDATLEVGEPNHWQDSTGPAAERTVWYSWTAPNTGYTVITTDGSSHDTLLMVYTGSQLNSLSLVVRDDDSGDGAASRVRFLAQSGQTYKICVAAYRNKHGRIELNLAPDLNNLFQNAITLSGFDGSISGSSRQGDTFDAGLEPGEPVIAGVPGGRSQWFKWTPTRDGQVTFETRGSVIDTLLGIYRGSSVSNLTVVGQDDNSAGAGPSRITFFATNGVTYRISVDGTNGIRGLYQLAWKSPKAPTLISQPSSTNILEGGLVRMAILADGAEPLHYQWLHNDEPLLDDGNISGTQGNTLVLGKTLQEHAGRYSIVVTNAFGAVTSAPAHIIVLDNPRAIYASTTDGYIGSAVDVPIRTLAVGDEREYRFSLNYDPALLSDPRLAAGSGAAGLTFEVDESQLGFGKLGVIARFPGTTTAPSGNFELMTVRLDIAPSAPVDGHTALSFKDSPIAKRIVLADTLDAVAVYAAGNVNFKRLPVPAGILQQPIGTNVIAGGDVQLQVTASGDAPLAYQWLHNGFPLGSSGTLTGNKSALLKIVDIHPAQQGNYKVQVTNLYGSILSADAGVVVLDNPRRLTLGTAHAPVGGTASVPITLSALGNEHSVSSTIAFDPAYLNTPTLKPADAWTNGTWVINDSKITNGLLGWSLTLPTNAVINAGTQTLATLTWDVSDSAPVDVTSLLLITNSPVARRVSSVSGSRLVTAFQDGAVSFDTTATFLPQILQAPVGLTNIEGFSFILSVTATGAPPIRYQWLKNNNPLVNGSRITGVTNSILSVPDSVSSDAGKFSVVLSNSFGVITSAQVTVTLTNNPRKVFTSASEVFLGENGTADLWMSAIQNEHAVSGSLQVDPAVVTNLSFSLGAAAASASVKLTTNQIGRGRVGFQLSLPGNQVFAPGTQHIARLSFRALPQGIPGTNSTWTITTTPIGRSVTDVSSNKLVTAYRGSSIKLLRKPLPPAIIASPASTNVPKGGTIQLAVTATGDAPLSYDWRLNGNPITPTPNISGLATSSLQIREADSSYEGSYAVIVTNAVGQTSSIPATVQITPNPRQISVVTTNGLIAHQAHIPIVLNAQGDEQDLQFSIRYNPLLLSTPGVIAGTDTAGANLSFETSSEQTNHVGIRITLPAGQSFGAGNRHVATLTLVVSPEAPHGTTTQLIPTNSPLDKVTLSTNAIPLATVYASSTLNIERAPTRRAVRRPPAALPGAGGDDAPVQVAATGDAPLTYAWFFNSNPLTPSPQRIGISDSKLTLLDTVLADGGLYSVQISNRAGTILSPTASLIVTNNPRKLRIPELTATLGQTVDIPIILDAVGQTKSAAFSLQWNTNHLELISLSRGPDSHQASIETNVNAAVPGNIGIKIIAGEGMVFEQGTNTIATATFLAKSGTAPGTTTPVEFLNSPTARQLLDLNGTALPTAYRSGIVHLNSTSVPPFIVVQPKSRSLVSGEDLSLTVTALGNTPLRYQWYRGSDPLQDVNGFEGAQTPQLLVTEASPAFAGSYTVTVSNSFGMVTSEVSTVTIDSNARQLRLVSTNGFVGDFATVSLELNASGHEQDIQFQITLDPALLTPTALEPGADSGNALLQWNPLGQGSGEYQISVTQVPGQSWAAGARHVASLVLGIAPQAVAGTTSPILISGPASSRSIHDQGGLKLPALFEGATVEFTASTTPPTITLHPGNTNVIEGADAQLEVSALGDPPLTFQWFKGTTALTDDATFKGTQTRKLLIREVDDSRSGIYFAVVSNPAGSAQSNPGSVGRLDNPRVVSLGTTDAVAGGTASLPVQIQAQGNERTVNLSLAYPAAHLSSPQFLLDPSITNASLQLNLSEQSGGRVGIEFSLPPGVVLAEGIRKLGSIRWDVALTAPPGQTVQVLPAQSPVIRSVADTAANALPTVYQGGSISFLPPPIPPSIIQISPSAHILQGASFSLQVQAVGDLPMSFEWRKDGNPLTDSANITGTATSKLSFTEATEGAAGTYTVVLRNVHGDLESPAIQIVIDPNPRQLRITEVEGYAGESVNIPVLLQADGTEHAVQFTVAFNPATLGNLFVTAGSNAPNLGFQLDTTQVAAGLLGIRASLPSGQNMPAGLVECLRFIALSTSPQLQEGQVAPLAIVSSPKARRIENGTGTALPAVYVGGQVTFHRRPQGPVILSGPAATNLLEGANLNLAAVVQGDAPLSFQWSRNGTPLANSDVILGAQSPQLSILDVNSLHQGSYSLLASNLVGTTNTVPVPVNILPNPRTLSLISTQTYMGEPMSLAVVLQSQGNENQLQFSIAFDPLALAPTGIRPDESHSEATTQLDLSQIADGRLGVLVEWPAHVTPPTGPVTVGWIDWNVASTGLTEGQLLSLVASPSPVIKQVLSADGAILPLRFVASQLTVTRRPLPPSIITAPTATNVLQGGTISLRVSAGGTPPLSYAWSKIGGNLANGGRFSGVLSSNLTIVNATASDSGDYIITITNTLGKVSSEPVRVDVLPNGRLIDVTSQNGFIGEPASVPLNLQAQGNEHQINLSLQFPPELLLNPSVIAGSNAQNATLETDPSRLNEGFIGVRLTLPNGQVFSAGGQEILRLQSSIASTGVTHRQRIPITLASTPIVQRVSDLGSQMLPTVYADGELVANRRPLPPSIVSQPIGLTAVEAEVVNLAVQATGDAPLGYQWRLDGNPITDGTIVDGSQTASLTLDGITPAFGGDYTVVVTNAVGSVTSQVARVEVIANQRSVRIVDASGFLGEECHIPIQLKAQGNEHSVALSLIYDIDQLSRPRVTLGSNALNAVLTVSTNNPDNGQIGMKLVLPGNTVFNNDLHEVFVLHLTASTNASLHGTTLPLNTRNNPVSRRVENANGTRLATVFDSGSLTLQRRPVPPFFVSSPTPTNVLDGGDLHLLASAGGDVPLSWVWLRNGAALVDGSGVSGSRTPHLVISPVDPNAQGLYSAAVSNNSGATTSAPVQINIVNNPRSLTWISTNAAFGRTVFVPIQLASQGNEHLLQASVAFDPAVLSNPKLVAAPDGGNDGLFTDVTQADSGLVGVRITRRNNESWPTGTRIVAYLTLDVTAEGVQEGQQTTLNISSFPLPKLVSSPAGLPLATRYIPATLTLVKPTQPPTLIQQPASTNIIEGAPLQLQGFASGDLPLFHHWFKGSSGLANSDSLDGAFTPTLSWKRIAASDAGDYSLVVTNASGSVTSQIARVTVLPNPRVIQCLDAQGIIGAIVDFPVVIQAQGNENRIDFTLQFDPAVLTPVDVKAGKDHQGSAADGFINPADPGKVWIIIKKPIGQSMPAGLLEVAIIQFRIESAAVPGANRTLPITDAMLPREVRDPNGVLLPALFQPGRIFFNAPTPPTLEVLLNAQGLPVVQVRGIAGLAYTIETSNDLVHWSETSSGTAGFDGILRWIDNADPVPGGRFYRAKSR